MQSEDLWALRGVKKVAYATFLNIALTHWSNGYAILPAVRLCKEAIPNGIVRKSPYMPPIFD